MLIHRMVIIILIVVIFIILILLLHFYYIYHINNNNNEISIIIKNEVVGLRHVHEQLTRAKGKRAMEKRVKCNCALETW